MLINSDLKLSHFTSIEDKLKAMNTKIVLLTIDAEEIKERLIIKRLDPDWQNYLCNFGKDIPEIINTFLKRQDQLKELVSKSSLKIRETPYP